MLQHQGTVVRNNLPQLEEKRLCATAVWQTSTTVHTATLIRSVLLPSAGVSCSGGQSVLVFIVFITLYHNRSCLSGRLKLVLIQNRATMETHGYSPVFLSLCNKLNTCLCFNSYSRPTNHNHLVQRSFVMTANNVKQCYQSSVSFSPQKHQAAAELNVELVVN